MVGCLVYAVTLLTYHDTTTDQVAAAIRGHWALQNSLHWVGTSPSFDSVHARRLTCAFGRPGSPRAVPICYASCYIGAPGCYGPPGAGSVGDWATGSRGLEVRRPVSGSGL